MGLACSQIMLLTLTSRKADCEYGISIDSMQKMALSREMSELSSEYYSKLQSKNISYYHNGQYNKMNYGYLMGYGSNYAAVWNQDQFALKSDKSMILTDYNGRVVLSDSYAAAITSVIGSSCMDSNGKGGTFSTDKIAAILAKLFHGDAFSEETFQNIIDEKELSGNSFAAGTVNTLTGQDTGKQVQVDNNSTVTEKMQAIVDFYYPIFAAAATNGWTTQYNDSMESNENYISDAISSGSMQLVCVNNQGNYDETGSLTYFITSGLVESRTDSDVRKEVTAWYEAEKEKIAEKETYIDLHMDELSTELEAINTEIQSIQSLIDDAIQSVFDWGAG